ncbi:unnamed protein product, partial [Musa textilis]
FLKFFETNYEILQQGETGDTVRETWGRLMTICTQRMEQKISSPEQQKWVTKLLGYDYEIT